MVLIGILVSLSAPSISNIYDKIIIELSANQLIHDIHLAKQHALASGKQTIIEFNEGTDLPHMLTYQILSQNKNEPLKHQVLNTDIKIQSLIPVISCHPMGYIEHQGSLLLSKGSLWVKVVYLHSGYTYIKKSW